MNYSLENSSQTTVFHACCPYHYSSMHAEYPKTINYFYDWNLFYARKIIFAEFFMRKLFSSLFAHLVSSLSQFFPTNSFRKLLKLCKIIAKTMRVHKPLDSGSLSLKLVTASEIKVSENIQTSNKSNFNYVAVTTTRYNSCYEEKNVVKTSGTSAFQKTWKMLSRCCD